MYAAFVEVSLRPGIADPQGSTIERAVLSLGFKGVSGMRTGKTMRFNVEATDEATARAVVDELARTLLTNPVIEDYRVELSEAESAGPK